MGKKLLFLFVALVLILSSFGTAVPVAAAPAAPTSLTKVSLDNNPLPAFICGGFAAGLVPLPAPCCATAIAAATQPD